MTNAFLAGGLRLAELPGTPVNQASQTISGNRSAAAVPYNVPRDDACNPRKEPMSVTTYEARRAARERDEAALAAAVARIEARPRDYLESVEECARLYVATHDAEREGGKGVTPRQVSAALERLRSLFDDE